MTKATGKPEIRTQQSSLERLHATIQRAKPAFLALGKKYIDPERFARIIVAAARRPPKKEGQQTLLDCTPESVVLACMEAAAVGLEPDTPQGHCFLIPYGGICTLQFGYPGLVALALRQPDIKRIESRLRYSKDVFEPQYAPTVSLKHIPCLDDAPGDLLGVYSIVHFSDGDMDFEYMTNTRVMEIKQRVKGSDNPASPWSTAYDEMAKKTALKRACKRWGKSKELKQALDIDNREDPKDRVLDPDISDFMSELAPPPRTLSLPPAAPAKSEAENEREAAERLAKTCAAGIPGGAVPPASKDAPSAGKPRCDRRHQGPPCQDPQCWLTGDPEP